MATPDRVEEIPAYLANVTSGRPLSAAVVTEIQHRYAAHRPLAAYAKSPCGRRRAFRAGAGAAHLRRHAQLEAVHPRHGSSDDSRRRHPCRCHLPCAAQFAHQRRPLRRAVIGETGKAPFTVDFVAEWHAEALLIRAFSEKLRDGWSRACLDANAPVPVLFTAHSVPVRTIDAGDDYERQTRETAALVAASVPEIAGHWRFAFQSQGMSGRRVARSYRRERDYRAGRRRTQTSVRAAHRLRLRSRRGALRYRYRVQEFRCRTWHGAVPRRVAE